MWTHFSRFEGGIGMRGLGETQIELDRRMIRKKLQSIEKELKNIEKRREREMAKRDQEFKISLVGYTNSGKSTLLNKLTGSSVFTQDKLFATL